MHINATHHASPSSQPDLSTTSTTAAPPEKQSKFLSKNTDFDRFNFKKYFSLNLEKYGVSRDFYNDTQPDALLEDYAPESAAKAREIESHYSDINNKSLRDAEISKEWETFNKSGTAPNYWKLALSRYLADRRKFLDAHKQLIFEVARYLEYSDYEEYATFIFDENSPVGKRCDQDGCPAIRLRLDRRTMDSVFTKLASLNGATPSPERNYHFSANSDATLRNIRLVATGDYGKKVISHLYLMDYETEKVLLDLGSLRPSELEASNWFVPKMLTEPESQWCPGRCRKD